MTKLTAFEESYIETACWSSTDDEGSPLDGSEHADVDFSADSIERIRTDCHKFIEASKPLLTAFVVDMDASVVNSANISENRVAHDFWLTRNRHGAGFWDGDYPEPLATQLTNLAHSFGECDLYIGDDRQFHIA